jgi:ABC-type glycerol-3-phosphate transport system permease component
MAIIAASRPRSFGVARVVNAAPYLLAIIWTLLTLLPIIWMYLSSLKTLPEYDLNPWLPTTSPQFMNYFDAWTGVIPGSDPRSTANIPLPFATYLFNSVVATGGSLALTLGIGILGAYALARQRVRGYRLVMGILVFGLVVPSQALVLPIWFAERQLNLTDTHLGLILAYTGTSLPFALLLLTAYFRSFPPELEDAGRVDGASELGILTRIVLPMSRGPIAAIGILLANGFWNEFLYALILAQTHDSKTLGVGLYNFAGSHFTPYTVLLAAMGIATAPVLILYLIFQRQITNADIELVR